MGWPGTTWITEVLRKPLLCEFKVTRRTRNLTGLLRDEVPEQLQVSDLIRFREFSEPRGDGNRRVFHGKTSLQAYRISPCSVMVNRPMRLTLAVNRAPSLARRFDGVVGRQTVTSMTFATAT